MFELYDNSTGELILPVPNAQQAGAMALQFARDGRWVRVQAPSTAKGRWPRLYGPLWAYEGRQTGRIPYRIQCPQCGNFTMWPKDTHHGGVRIVPETCRECSYPRRTQKPKASRPPEEKLLGSAEAGEILGLTRRQVWGLAKRGVLKPAQVTAGGDKRMGVMRFRRADVEALRDARSSGGECRTVGWVWASALAECND